MHKPVLLDEVVNMIPKKGIHVDATLGAGGHLGAVCDLGDHKLLIAIDRDQSAIELAKQNLKNCSANIKFVCEEFRNLNQILEGAGIQQIDSVLFDLGVSSMQLDTPGRGFSFMRDEPLQMTMSTNSKINAEIIVNEWQESVLADALYHLADERNAKRIASAIVMARNKKRIKTTFELVDIVKSVSRKYSKTNPATKTFQALRMLVNEELQNIEEGLNAAWAKLAPGGRILVITFHSIEDRIVKQIFKKFATENLGKLVTKKPIIPTREEIISNKRSRSAKLRIIEKNGK